VDNLLLNGPLLAELYGDTLIESPEFRPVSVPPNIEKSLTYLGNNTRKIILLVETKTPPDIPASDFQFLSNLLKACKLSLDDVAILSCSEERPSIKLIKTELVPREILLFGINPVSIGVPINFPAFKIHEYDDTYYLYAPGLGEINRDTEDGKLLKSKLWVCLKQLFQL
jgi:hypothetical protein